MINDRESNASPIPNGYRRVSRTISVIVGQETAVMVKKHSHLSEKSNDTWKIHCNSLRGTILADTDPANCVPSTCSNADFDVELDNALCSPV